MYPCIFLPWLNTTHCLSLYWAVLHIIPCGMLWQIYDFGLLPIDYKIVYLHVLLPWFDTTLTLKSLSVYLWNPNCNVSWSWSCAWIGNESHNHSALLCAFNLHNFILVLCLSQSAGNFDSTMVCITVSMSVIQMWWSAYSLLKISLVSEERREDMLKKEECDKITRSRYGWKWIMFS